MAVIETANEIPPSGLIVCMMENHNRHMTFEQISRNAPEISGMLHKVHRIYTGISFDETENMILTRQIEDTLRSMEAKGYIDIIRSDWLPCHQTEIMNKRLYFLCNNVNTDNFPEIWQLRKEKEDIIIPSKAIITAANEVIKEYYFRNPF